MVTALRDAAGRDGSPLAAALAQHPQSFSRLYVGAGAGEASGRLAETLDRLAELHSQLPLGVTLALIILCVLLVAAIGARPPPTQVLPRLRARQQSGASLPPSTQFLIDAGLCRE